MKKILKTVDAISEWTAKLTMWLCVVLVIVMSYEVILRYAFNSPTMWAYESSMMLGGTIFASGWAYVHLQKGHIRVDLFYQRYSPRTKAIIDVIFALVLLFPLLSVLIYTSYEYALHAWKIGEKSAETYWYPPAAPFRTVVLTGFFLFALQCVSQFIRDLYFCISNEPYV